MIEIYLLNIHDIKIDDAFFKEYFPNRYQRSLNYRNKEDQLRSLGVGLILFKELKVKEKDIAYLDNGKPYLINGNKKISISHSGDYVTVALANRDLGIDIEKIKINKYDVKDKVFTAKEIDWCIDLEKFYTIWTVKESLSKINGEGLRLNLKNIDVLDLINNKMLYEDNMLYSRSYLIDDHLLSVVMLDNEEVRIARRKYE